MSTSRFVLFTTLTSLYFYCSVKERRKTRYLSFTKTNNLHSGKKKKAEATKYVYVLLFYFPVQKFSPVFLSPRKTFPRCIAEVDIDKVLLFIAPIY